jgi:hypothetical protein
MAGRARSEERAGNGGQARPAEPAGAVSAETTTTTGGGRAATLNLPFVTAQFRAPDHLVPTRDDVTGVARNVRSILPSGKSTLFYGGLALTAVIGAIEWPVAAAIGVGAALASRGAADPRPARQLEGEQKTSTPSTSS